MRDENILVIEDNELNMKLVRELLQIGGYNIFEATDAETGLNMIREHHPDLILMDIQLPGMDGLCATKLIKKDPSLKNIPIIALTAYAMKGDKEKALLAGCIGYISKPINTREFFETVAKFTRH